MFRILKAVASGHDPCQTIRQYEFARACSHIASTADRQALSVRTDNICGMRTLVPFALLLAVPAPETQPVATKSRAASARARPGIPEFGIV